MNTMLIIVGIASFGIGQVPTGDVVPADGRIISSATLETQEAALTGESSRRASRPGRPVGRRS